MSKVLQERGFRSLPSSMEMNPKDHVKLILTAKANSDGIRHIGSGLNVVSNSQHSKIFSETIPFPRRLHDYYCDEWKEAREVKILETCSNYNTLPQKEKNLRSFTLPYFVHNVCFDKALVDLGASVSVIPISTYTNLGLGDLVPTRLTIELADGTIKHPRGITENVLVRIDVFKRKITLRVGESIKPATSIIKRVYMLKEGTNLDSKTKLVGEAVNESFDPLYGNYIELNDLDVPLEPRMNQDNNLEPTIDENAIVNEPLSKVVTK
ncbi:retrovirus-related pol polyprotein from transposon TNT 1-94 [Tanacetum coccineum]